MTDQDKLRAGAIASAAVITVAAFLPWVTVTTIFGSVSRSGVDGNGDGLFTAALGIAAALAMVARWWPAGIVCAGLVALIAAYDMVDVQQRVNDTNVNGSIGFGLYVTMLAAIALGVLSILYRTQRPQTTTWAPPVVAPN